MKLLEPQWLWALWILPVLAVVIAIGIAASSRALGRFFGVAAGRPWAGSGAARSRALLGVLTIGAIGLSVMALARPGINPVPKPSQRPGRDLVFIIDVSRSMLSQDLRPSRLERAKLAAKDVLEVVDGDRVAVVAFAGTAVVKCPLTTDYTFARMALDDLSPNSVSRGGTSIGDAIRTAMSQLFGEAGATDAPKRIRTVVLMTDGEDQESKPVEAAEEAGKKGVRIVTIGLGSEIVGAPVPAAELTAPSPAARRTSDVMEYQGKPVESRMNSSVLKDIAAATPGGVFLNVGTGNVELDTVYSRLLRTRAAAETTDSTAMRYTELFQWALAAALALLFMEGLARAIWR